MDVGRAADVLLDPGSYSNPVVVWRASPPSPLLTGTVHGVIRLARRFYLKGGWCAAAHFLPLRPWSGEGLSRSSVKVVRVPHPRELELADVYVQVGKQDLAHAGGI